MYLLYTEYPKREFTEVGKPTYEGKKAGRRRNKVALPIYFRFCGKKKTAPSF